MKRAREEEVEVEEQEQEAALMALSPTRNPVPAAAAPASGTGDGEERVLTMQDTVHFVLSVRRAFDRAKYHEFLHVISRIDSIGVRGIVDRMKVLLRGHADVKRYFNMFLPTQYELSLTDDVVQQEEAPTAGSQQGRPAGGPA